jgi:WD40 repeat protein
VSDENGAGQPGKALVFLTQWTPKKWDSLVSYVMVDKVMSGFGRWKAASSFYLRSQVISQASPSSLFPPMVKRSSGSADRTIRWWSLATGQEMLLFQDAGISSRNIRLQAELNPDGNTVIWQERQGPIRVTTLPTLAEMDATEKRMEGKTQ